MTITEIYNAAFAHSHEAGLQAVWDAAVAAVKAEAEALETEFKAMMEDPAPAAPPDPRPVVPDPLPVVDAGPRFTDTV
ncbi:MAG: hypothetical protein JWR07_1922 [Nevskia sp.]|nr:hypothetical protein [Nevskia sp.]